MTTIAAAALGALGAIMAALVAAWVRQMERSFQEANRKVRADLDACLRDRQALRQLVQLIAGAFVGLLPERERLTLLRAIDETVMPVDEAAQA